MPLRSGFVSILGLPNAGKSTLTNELVGEKVAIVTRKPQTTRNRIHGVLDVDAVKGKHPAAQIVFVDTPGVHKPNSLLDKRMLQEVHDALESRDVVLHVVDTTRRRLNAPGSEDALIDELVDRLECPVFLVLNKIDAIDEKGKLLPLIADLSTRHNYAEVVPISARSGDGLDRLLQKLIEHLPEGQRYFRKGQYTDQPERFLAAEIIREKILNLTGEEVPYASAVVIERWEEPRPVASQPGKPKRKPLTRIAAAIYCERSGQKAILIGKGGAMLKQIGMAARKELESMLGTQVHLELFVKVADDWRGSRTFLDSLDWRNQLEELGRKIE
jgi:GTP-binding protein Era